MSSTDQHQSILVPDPAHDPAAEALALPSVVGEAMIERAKSVVVVAQRVDEDEAAQILLDAASKADIPMHLAADQVMTALEAEVSHEGMTHDTLERALAAVRPMEETLVEETLVEETLVEETPTEQPSVEDPEDHDPRPAPQAA